MSYLLDDGPKVGLPGGADPPPPRYKGGVLPLNYGSEKRGARRRVAWCAVVESNHRPSDYESPVLPLNQPRGIKWCPMTVLPRLLLLEREVT